MSHLEDLARSSGGHAVAPATVSEKRERLRPSDHVVYASKISLATTMVAGLTLMHEALSNQRSLILIGLLFVVSVSPVLMVEIPAMIDYVNHLARMHLLVDAAAGRPNPAYEIHCRFYPNLAMDIIVPTLARFVSVETAARLFLLASQALVVSGAMALEIAV